jgi:lysophospholipase L1-like esterase
MGRMLVLGDSILWGQGLEEVDKCSSLVAAAWSAATATPIDVQRFAHSGADIWDDGPRDLMAALNPEPPAFPEGDFSVGDDAVDKTPASSPTLSPEEGEIPKPEPYLLAQILAAGRLLANEVVDLVLVDMGVNDTEIYNLVLPGKRTDVVVARARSLAPRVRFALDRIGATFPQARVLVTGYYPLVSLQTDADEILQFTRRVFDAVGGANPDVPNPLSRLLTEARRVVAEVGRVVPGGQKVERAAGEVLDAVSVPNLADRSQKWAEAMNTMLQEAVANFDAGRRIAAFVDPAFRPEHAIFAPESLLWAFHKGDPTDPMAEVRRKFCDAQNVLGFERIHVECASLGHPAQLGARRYADAAIAEAKGLRVF